jgi:hypothetical protein
VKPTGGHSEIGNFINADQNYQIFRRFGLLRTWALLDLQHDLNALEQRLKDNPEDLEDKELMTETRAKLKDYGDLIKQQYRFMSLDQPNIQNHVELLSWAQGSGFRDPKDLRYNWLYHRDDLAIIAPNGENAGISIFEGFLLNLMILLFPPEFIKVLRDTYLLTMRLTSLTELLESIHGRL